MVPTLSLRVDRFEADHVVTPQARNRAGQHRLQPLALTDFAADFRRHAFIGRAIHQAQRPTHAVVREQIQKRRLPQIHRQRFFERTVKDRIACLVVEIGEQD